MSASMMNDQSMIELEEMRGLQENSEVLNESPAAVCPDQFKSNLKKKIQCVFEGISKAGDPTLLNQIYTELYITEGGAGGVNHEHEVRQIEMAFRRSDRAGTAIRHEDIFKTLPGRDRPIRTVMTKGVAGIGKTVLTQRFSLDWAEDKDNQDIHFIFPLTFRELNVLKERKFSLVELVHHFFPETKDAGICRFDQFQVVFIFDGLDECRLSLDFHNTEVLTDVTESTSVNVLLTNLMRGKLLPSAHLWITTRPASANQIPLQYVDRVTEVRGFSDPRKEEYFRKRLRDEEQARKIISHIKTSRSLHIMCHIPVFCWITATVLEELLKSSKGGELPKTLTEMYIHFLVFLMKNDGGAETDPHWSKKSRKMIKSLGKLAFEQLQKGNLIFYKSDLRECGINIRAARVFTPIFKEERGLYQDKVFCFIHLSIQEFLAALHVHQTFIKSGVNLLSEEQTVSCLPFRKTVKQTNPTDFYQSAVYKALRSPNGHLDLFLRFLLGLSLESSQTLLQHLMSQIGSISQTNQETVQFINKISVNLSTEKNNNLFHCLNELNNHPLEEDIQQPLRSGRLSPYACELEPDMDTVNGNLKCSDRTVTNVTEKLSYPDHPDRFDYWPQLLCRTGLTGRCYWEVEWRGRVHISVSYRGIRGKEDTDDCLFGRNDQSWSLFCSDGQYSVWHKDKETLISSSCVSNRAAVYVDCPAGTLSFYRVSSDTLIHLHTFNATFTEPLYPGFWISDGSSVSL